MARTLRPRPELGYRPASAPPLAKSVSMPPAIEASMAAQGMDNSAQLGPGRPMEPAWGYSTRPRAMDYPVGVNITTADGRASWGRTSFATLKAIIDAYDVARDCINHKIDELRSMEPLFQPADGVRGDVDEAIVAARLALQFPDRQDPYDAWLSRWLEGVLRYDAGYLFKRRNYWGEVVGLEVLDGPTIAPKVDEFGRRPQAPAPAWQQIVHGLPAKDFTVEDITPTIFRPQPDSPFGLAPMEAVLLTANTDLKFQLHFLQMFTEGTVPAGFVELPESASSPDQVAEWQDYWDALLLGDQSMLRRLRAVPAGTKVTETRPEGFDTAFAEHLMVRTAMAFGVVPQDLGIVKDVNRANGETQTDMQFRVNTLPWVRFVEGTLSRYLQRDLGLPVKVALDTGREKEDRLTEAQAWAIYIDKGLASPDEGREKLLGLPTDNERPVPRFYADPHTGPVPLRSIEAIAGPIDPDTLAPTEAVPLDTTAFEGAGGVMPWKPPGGTQFKRAPVDPDEPTRPELERPVAGSELLGVAPATRPTIDTVEEGQTATQLLDSEDPNALSAREQKFGGAPVAKASVDAELAAFRRFVAKRARAGRWRDFSFTVVDEATARGLNRHARARVRKAAGQVVAAGLAVVAADTGRVLMLQRALDPADPNGGCWEFPGGHVEDGENPADAARREWSEETGLEAPYADGGDPTPAWTSGVYAGFVQVVPAEDDVPIFDRVEGSNPDDPDGDAVEALAWWDPATLAGNPAVRPELAAALDVVLPRLEVGRPVEKAGGADPKAVGWY